MSFRTAVSESSCARLEPLLLRLPDGDLTAGEHSQLERHLAFCERCRRAARGLTGLGETLRSAAPREDGLPSGAAFAARLRASEERRRPGFVRLHPACRWSLAGALAAGIAALYRPPAPAPGSVPTAPAAAQPQGEAAPMLFVVDDEEGRRVVLAATGSRARKEP